MLKTAQEEIAWSDKLWQHTDWQALRDQQDYDLGLWGPFQFAMDKREGAWKDMTSNRFTMRANHVVSLLSSSWMQLFIAVDEGDRKNRSRISKTEQFALGCLDLADRLALNSPSGQTIQDALAFLAPLRGGSVVSVLQTEDEDGNFDPGITVYDAWGSQWDETNRRVLKFCYRDNVTNGYVQSLYSSTWKGDTKGKDGDARCLYTFLDEQGWKVACGNEYVDEGEHGLGYVPVRILPCGSVPRIGSGKYEHLLKYRWQSVFANDRNIAEIQSELLSIERTKAIRAGKIIAHGVFDSTKSATPPLDEVEKLGYGKDNKDNNTGAATPGASGKNGELIMMDAGKGQELRGVLDSPDNAVVDQFLQRIDSMTVPTATGEQMALMARSSSGIVASYLKDADFEFISPFRRNLEQQLVWIAEECVRQFKQNHFKKVSVEGKNKARQKFYATDISPADVDDKVHFECQLVADRLRDQIQETGAAINEVKSGILSKRTALQKHNVVEDPDKELELIDEERHKEMGMSDPVAHHSALARHFKDQGDIPMALYHQRMAQVAVQTNMQQLMMALAPQMMQGQEPQGAQPMPGTPASPQQQAAAIAREPMTGLENSMRAENAAQ